MSIYPADQVLGGLFDWTWQTSLRASILILLVFLVCRLLGKRLAPVWLYGLWFLVVVRLLLPVAPPASFSLLNAMPAREPAGLEGSPPATLVLPELVWAPTPPRHAAGLVLERPSGSSSLSWWTSRFWSWRSVCVLGWLSGVIVCLGHAWQRHRRWRRVLGDCRDIQNPAVLALLQTCEAEVGCTKRVRLVQTSRLGTPAVLGWCRPCLLLPESVLDNFCAEELRLVMLHELIHIRRRDVAANWLLILLQAWHWFNPLVWVACRQFRAARELYCDALVLRHLEPRDQRAYGQILVKLAERLSSARLSPGLVPVLHRKSELKRRILMMTQQAKAPRLFSFVAAAWMVVLVGLTFTGAAQQDEAAAGDQPKETPAPSPNKEKAAERGIRILENELGKIEAQVRHKQVELDELRSKLKLTVYEEVSRYGSDLDTETFRYLERALIDARSQCQKLTSLYEQLKSMTRAELRQALPTASPDSTLSALLENQALYEQQLALKLIQYDAAHPEVQGLKKMLETIHRQMEERIDGVMMGLKTRLHSEQATVQQLQTQLKETKEDNIHRAIEVRPYFLAKRDLESLQLIRERLQLRIQQEKVDAAAQVEE